MFAQDEEWERKRIHSIFPFTLVKMCWWSAGRLRCICMMYLKARLFYTYLKRDFIIYFQMVIDLCPTVFWRTLKEMLALNLS